MNRRSGVHLISKPIAKMSSPPVLPFSNTSVLPLPTVCSLVMPAHRSGPWTLDKVKKRLRAEQVQRETLAAARYRLEEDQGNEQENKTNQTKVFTQSGLVLFLSLSCLLLLLLVLVLSSVVVALTKK